MTRINIATHTRTLSYRTDRLWRDVKREADRLFVELVTGALIFALGLVAIAMVPVRRRPTRLSVAASLMAVAGAYLSLAVVAFGASPAWLAALVLGGGAAFVQATQAFPSDHGFWLVEVQEVALELIEHLAPGPPGSG